MVEAQNRFQPKRFFKDGDYALDKIADGGWKVIEAATFLPLALTWKDYRTKWFTGMIDSDCSNGLIDQPTAAKLRQQAGDPHTDRLLKDVMFSSFGVYAFDIAVSSQLIRLGLESDNWTLMLYSAFQNLSPLVPKITPGSLLRCLYLSSRMIEDRFFRHDDLNPRTVPPLKEAGMLLLSAWNPWGIVAAPLRVVEEEPDKSKFLIFHFLDQVIRRVPVVGGRGSKLERTAQNLFYHRWVRNGSTLSPEIVNNE